MQEHITRLDFYDFYDFFRFLDFSYILFFCIQTLPFECTSALYTMYACKLTYVSGSATTLLDIHCVSFIFLCLVSLLGWLGSRVVSVLDSGAEGSGFKSQSRRCRVSLRQTVYTHRASVHQAAKLVAALLRVAGVTAGLAESNGSLPPGL